MSPSDPLARCPRARLSGPERLAGAAGASIQLGSCIAQSLQALRVDGSLCLVGALTRQPIAFPAPHMIYGNLHVSGITVGSRQQQLDMVKAVETGGLHPVIDSVHSFHDLPEAFGALKEQRHFGKIAIEYD